MFNSLITKGVLLYKENRLVFLLVIPLLFLLFFLIFVRTATVEPGNKTSNISPTRQPASNNPPDGQTDIKKAPEYAPEYSLHEDELIGIQKKEQLGENTIKYTLNSPNTSHPNIVIVKNDELVFRRSVNPPNDLQPIDPFISMYGEPDRIVRGSKYYGGNYEKYIFAHLGFTLIVDSNNKLVVEQHFYIPTTATEYLQRFGEESL